MISAELYKGDASRMIAKDEGTELTVSQRQKPTTARAARRQSYGASAKQSTISISQPGLSMINEMPHLFLGDFYVSISTVSQNLQP